MVSEVSVYAYLTPLQPSLRGPMIGRGDGMGRVWRLNKPLRSHLIDVRPLMMSQLGTSLLTCEALSGAPLDPVLRIQPNGVGPAGVCTPRLKQHPEKQLSLDQNPRLSHLELVSSCS